MTPAGIGKEAFRRGILEPVSHVGPIKRFPEEAGAFVASEVKGFRLNDHVPDPVAKRLPRHTQFALAGTAMALTDARLTFAATQALSPLVVTGTSLMDSEVINKTIENVTRKGPRHGLSRVVFQGPVSSVAAAVLLNLCFNAIQAVEAREGQRWVSVGTRNTGAGLEMVIEDSGPGIATEIRERIFQPFQTTKSSGFGLGLAICSDILTNLSATISVDPPAVGRGATFRVTFPCQPLSS